MKKDLGLYRKNYNKFSFSEIDIEDLDPMKLFDKWFQKASDETKIEEPNAMTLSTIGKDGGPQNRIVLLKEYNEEGFIFYTNYKSNKARSITKNNQVALSFFWPPLQKQILIKGKGQKLDKEKSFIYFASRPRESQLAAWASEQSQILESREFLEKEYEKQKIYFQSNPMKKPKNWGGFLVKPYEIEFWQGRENRLHDRICFFKQKTNWTYARLFP